MIPRPETDVTSGVPFVKMEAVGNDFVVVNEADFAPSDLSALAIRACDRRFGVGGDGLLTVSSSDRADFKLRMFNPDGTEDHCGNGMRCAVCLYAGGTDGVATGERRFTLEALAGVTRARAFLRDGAPWIETEMGEPRLAPADLPMKVDAARVVDYPLWCEGETLRVTVVSTGTTHTVLFTDATDVAERFERVSPALETHPVFPDRTSVMWAIPESPERLRIRIWERGVGETLGCGTGACATMVAAKLTGRVKDHATVVSPGGALEVEWPGRGPMMLTGQAREVYRGTFSPAWLRDLARDAETE